MTAKEYLTRARTLDRELIALERARERTIAQLTNSTQTLTGDTVQSTKDPHKFDRLGDLAVEIQKRTRELDKVRSEILRTVNRVPDGLCRIVLIERYLNVKSFERVAVDNNISIRNVWRIHGRALRFVEGIIND